MKRLAVILALSIMFLFIWDGAYAQNATKSRTRLSISYVKIMNDHSYLDIKASARVESKTVGVAHIDLEIHHEIDSVDTVLGTVSTDMDGMARFQLEPIHQLTPDTSAVYTLNVVFNGNEAFRKVSKQYEFRDAVIEANLTTVDSTNVMNATLIDSATGEPISEEPLTLRVQRLFRPLTLGEEFNFTDDGGSISVPVEDGIPGIDGLLNLEVVLLEHDDYGTVIDVVEAPIGVPIVDESTYDERTMWSPRNKTPIYLLIIPNVLTFGMWATIIYLFINLSRIRKFNK
jgi:hypothetical protein